MTKRRIGNFILAGTLALASIFAVGCGASNNEGSEDVTPDGASMNTYKIEAEYCDLSKVQGAGISSDQKGVQMIHGDGTNKSWSEGYYLAHTHTAKFSLDFEFEADVDGNAVLFIYLGTDIQGQKKYQYTPNELTISVNGESIEYGKFMVPSSADLDNMKFVRCTISNNAVIKKGKNIVNVKVNPNTLKNNETGGALIDYLEVKTKSTLNPVQLKDNIDKRDGDGF